MCTASVGNTSLSDAIRFAHFVRFARQNEQIRCVAPEIRLLGIGSAHSAFRSSQSERILMAWGFQNVSTTMDLLTLCALFARMSKSAV